MPIPVLLCLALAQTLGEPSVIPLPVSMVREDGEFKLTPRTRIETDPSTRPLGEMLANYLDAPTGWRLPVSEGRGPHIRLLVDPFGGRPEGYRMKVDASGVEIRGSDAAGVFYGIQTLRQLLPAQVFSDHPATGVEWTVPYVRIEDYPRFPWRGMMLDCSRHFFPKPFIEKFIDLISAQKMNTFHWHLTDDQGWRIEIKKYPKLTQIGGFRKETLIGAPHRDPKDDQYDHTPYSGFYTQADIKEVVKYAEDRFVKVVPEIEMPGHSAAALASYPDLATNPPVEVWTSWGVNPNTINLEDSTFEFYQNVLDEVFRLFPSAFVHLGGDEAPTDQWAASLETQLRMQRLEIPSFDKIQPYITARMAQFVASKGRRMVGWDEILNADLPPGVVVMSWRGTEGGEKAAAAGHDVVMAPGGFVYFGQRLQIEKTYGYDPCPPSFSPDQAKHVLGAQGEIWCEHELTHQNVEYAAFPNSTALAEVDWTPQGQRSFSDFSRRLEVQMKRLQAAGVSAHTSN